MLVNYHHCNTLFSEKKYINKILLPPGLKIKRFWLTFHASKDAKLMFMCYSDFAQEKRRIDFDETLYRCYTGP